MKGIFLTVMFVLMCLMPTSVWGQIKIMDIPKQNSVSIQIYDSLTNFEEKPYGENNPNFRGRLTYHHLIGQTAMYCGSMFKKCTYGDYYKIESINFKHNVPYLRLMNKRTKHHIEVTGISYNTQFIIQGHYEKIKQLFVGKKFRYEQPYSEALYYDVKTGNYAQIYDGSIWKCIDVQVENRKAGKLGKYSPLLLIFQSVDDGRKIYCYYEAFYDMKEIEDGDKDSSYSNAKSQYFISKYGNKYEEALDEIRLEKGMTKAMVESLFGKQNSCTKNTTINISGRKTEKKETWTYHKIIINEDKSTNDLILEFEEEKLSNWYMK